MKTPLAGAVRTIMQQVPALKVDSRPESLKDAAEHLKAQHPKAAALIAKADLTELSQTRSDLLADGFDPVKAVVPKTAAKPPVVVSGGSNSGMATAFALAKMGEKVVLVEARPNHTRDIRFGSRQGMVDVLCMLDPKLATEFESRMAKLESMKGFTAGGGPAPDHQWSAEQLKPDGARVPRSGAELMAGGSGWVAIAREFESLIEAHVKATFPGEITFVQGKLHAVKQPDGNMAWDIEKTAPTKDSPGVYEPLPGGINPSMVVVAEGAGSATRAALEIDTAPTTPQQWWTAGVIGTTDKHVETPGNATLREYYDETTVKDASGASHRETQWASMISDGSKGSWVLVQMPPGFGADPKRPQSEINDYYFKRAALVMDTSEDSLRAAGATGPIAMPNSQPTAFPLQGKASREAAKLLPNGTIVAMIGDAVQTSTFQAGGGMNTAVSEVLPVLTLMADLQSGVKPQKAVDRFEASVFERGGAWSAAGIEYFYPRMPESEGQKLIAAQLDSIAMWRKLGGPSPLARMEKIIAEQGIGTEPLGLKLAA